MDSIANLAPELQRVFTATIKAESKPIQQIEERKASIEERVKLLTNVLGKVEDVKKLIPGMNTELAIRDFLVNSTDDKVASGSADKNVAQKGEYSLEVLKLAATANALSNRFPDKNETCVGSGYFTFSGPDGETKEVFVDNETGTLEGVAQAINRANVGMNASVVNDQTDPDNPYRLLLSASGFGSDQIVDYPEFYFIDGDEDFYIEEERPASNARVRYQGFDLESPSNELKELIAGVTLNLKGTTQEGKPLGIAVKQDIPKTVQKMKDIITGVNAVLTFIQEQNKMDAQTPGFKTLGGDYGIRMAEQRLRTVLHQNFSEGNESLAHVRVLSDMGIEFSKQGTLNYDDKKFTNALDSNFEETVTLLAGDVLRPGLIPQLNVVLGSFTAPGTGLLSNQKTNYMERVQKMNTDIHKKEEALEKKAEGLKLKLAKVQGALSQMQTQQGALSTMGSGGSPLMNALSQGTAPGKAG